MITRREFSISAMGAMGAVALPVVPGLAQARTRRVHGSSLIGRVKYPAGYARFDYANPSAPKGGAARIAGIGGFNSFNPYITKGDAVNVGAFVFDTLTHQPLDEGSTAYGLLAEWIESPDDHSWAAFRLRDGAHWHDGAPVVVEDVIFSLNVLVEKGQPFWRFYYRNVSEAVDLGDRVVRFEFDQTGNRELPHIMGQLPVLPRHWWAERDFSESSLEPPLGSGPYRVGDFEVNRFVEFERVEDYWAQDLPVQVGHENFDRVRFDYYRDSTAAFEAFKAGDIDFWSENESKRWATGYDIPAVNNGQIVKREHVEEGPKTVQAFIFNLRRGRFADARVRTALDLLFDFEWTNSKIFYSQYARPASYFQGSPDLMPADGPPTGRERELLELVREWVPDSVFGPAYRPNRTDGSGRMRSELRQAQTLFAEAGWNVVDGRLVNADGEVFSVEFLTSQDAQLRVVGPFFDNLRRVGVETTQRVVDVVQYQNRIRDFDFDMAVWGWRNSESPGNEQRDYWGAHAAAQPGSRNVAGVDDPAVEALIEKIVFAPDRAELAAASRALDRVLTHNRYSILELYTPFERLAYWDRFGQPDPLPPRSHGFPTVWWWDQARNAALETG